MMPEPRDRLARPVDIAAVFVRRRSAGVGVLLDNEGETLAVASPLRQGPAAAMGTPAPTGTGVTRGNGFLGTPRTAHVRGRNLYATPLVRRQNTSAAGSSRRARGRSTNSVLPSWYPRTPLRDITAIVRAIERTRARQREMEGQEMQSPVPEGQRLLDSSVSRSSAQLEHMITPVPTVGIKPHAPFVGKVPKILLDIANQNAEDSECLTPQKKLLNSIDTVEKVVKEELQKLKRTPTAKKAEREKRVRTLMSMR